MLAVVMAILVSSCDQMDDPGRHDCADNDGQRNQRAMRKMFPEQFLSVRIRREVWNTCAEDGQRAKGQAQNYQNQPSCSGHSHENSIGPGVPFVKRRGNRLYLRGYDLGQPAHDCFLKPTMILSANDQLARVVIRAIQG